MAARVKYPGVMKRPFFKEWREARKWTLNEALERLIGIGVEISGASLSRYENGDQPYSQDVLFALADIYGCDPEDLLTINPMKPDPPKLVYDALRKAPPERQAEVWRMIEALLKTGTNG
jgi:transcriptional regulator with XRE-family HTH domain